MTVQQLALQLLGLSGVPSLAPDTSGGALLARGTTGGDLTALATTINNAFQEIFSVGPASLSERQDGATLNAPATVTLTATNGSKTIAITAAPSWIAGCTIRINGDQWDNQLVSATSLVRPFIGTTGSTTATIFGDAVRMDSTIKNVLSPFSIPGRQPLDVCASREEFDQYPRPTGGLKRGAWPYFLLGGSVNPVWQKLSGTPRAVYVDSSFDATLGYLPMTIHVTPMPTQAVPLTYRLKLHAPIFVATDIDNGDHSTDPGKAIPQLCNESILLAVAKWHWMEQPSVVLSDRQSNAITEGYKAAIKSLEGLVPQVGSVEAVWE